ncbi:MAG TPA: LamG-like jellyroll fold domain-containing protein, partial [Bryobacteraceae bacterium]|nr:LamG-like jellyroll fold domain-containing protein [Bryobacteraceae bacterium]
LDTTSGYCATSGSIPLDNAFHHVALTYDAAKSQLNAYIDGVGRPYPTACSGTVAMPQNALTIGRFANGSGVQAVFDELRVSAGVPRSQAWLATAFNNQKSPASFYTVTAPEIR